MKKTRILAAMLAAVMAFSLAACSKENEEPEEEPVQLWNKFPEDAQPVQEEVPEEVVEEEPVEEEPEEEAYVLPEGMYYSETTGEPISEELRNQRPVSIMVDDDERALPHFGTADTDVLYELINSMANNRVTRYMCVVKDWGKLEQFGSIRSVRPTNILLNAEWNGVLCHDGGPFYINDYLNKGYTDHFSGTFSRVNNGKATEFTEYCLPGDLDKNFNNTGVSRSYNSHKPDDDTHFNFIEYGKEVTLDSDDSIVATKVNLPHWHNKPWLQFNEETGTYDYYQYQEAHKDGADGRILSFKNVILQDCTIHQYDENGYMIYNCIAEKQPGWYITNGRAIPITWSKFGDQDITRYYDANGNEITLNTGKTYITLISSDVWGDVGIGG